MEATYTKTPIGITKIGGDENGHSVISVSDQGKVSSIIKVVLQEAFWKLNDYFEGKCTDFTLQLNPSGTDFQQKVWKSLLEIPFGKEHENPSIQQSLF